MDAYPAFDRDPYLTELDVEVLRTSTDERGFYVVLDDTILYPEGGGQPADRGLLGSASVLDVQKHEGEFRHYVLEPVSLGPARVFLDWPRRFDHMQQHTGQHLLTAVAQDLFGWATTAFHLGESRCDIELKTDEITPESLVRLEETVAAEIRAARLVSARHVAPEAYATMAVRSRGLPDGHVGDVRLVEIDGLDLNTCGGTHVRSTAELELIKLIGTESIRGGTRLFFVVGGRARLRMAAHERRNASLRALLGAPDEDLVVGVEAKLAQLNDVDRRCRVLEDELVIAAVESLSFGADRLLDRHFEGKDAGFLQKLARQFVSARPQKIVFLSATREGSSCFVLAAGEASGFDVTGIGRDITVLMDAKGGGAKGFFQGKAGNLAGRDAVLAHLRSLV